MSAIQGATVRIQTLCDGTLRLTADVEPANAQAAFRLFGSPGTPIALARIKTVTEKSTDATRPKGGALAKLAGQWCASAAFAEFIRPIYDRAMGGDGSGWGDVAPRDFNNDTALYARHCILVLCDINSRRELDHNAAAAAKFHNLIRQPWIEHQAGD